MTRLDSCSQRSALVAALMAVAGAACAPAARGALTHVGPMCVAPASPHWAVSQGRASRTLTVRLEVLSEASASWRLDGRMRLDTAIAAWNRAGLPVRLARVSEREAASIRVIVMRRLPLEDGEAGNSYRAGMAHLQYDERGEIGRAEVVVAEQTPGGTPYSAADQDGTLRSAHLHRTRGGPPRLGDGADAAQVPRADRGHAGRADVRERHVPLLRRARRGEPAGEGLAHRADGGGARPDHRRGGGRGGDPRPRPLQGDAEGAHRSAPHDRGPGTRATRTPPSRSTGSPAVCTRPRPAAPRC
jgi:hypothetical protein